jgi:hypothetical protein
MIRAKRSAAHANLIFANTLLTLTRKSLGKCDILRPTSHQIKGKKWEPRRTRLDMKVPNRDCEAPTAIMSESYSTQHSPEGAIAVTVLAAKSKAVTSPRITRAFFWRARSLSLLVRFHQAKGYRLRLGKEGAGKGGVWSLQSRLRRPAPCATLGQQKDRQTPNRL